jgi:5-methylcytosine-specific restriction endonuclease McrA
MAAISAVDAPQDETSVRAAVVAAGRIWADSQQELVRLVVELDDSLEWALDGAPTCAHWVASALEVQVCTAREWLRIGRMLRELPATAQAFAERKLSYSKVRALTRVATPTNEAELCTIAARVPAGRLAHALAAWLIRHETPEQTEARQHAARGLQPRVEPDGMVATMIRLPPLEHGRLIAAIDAQVLARRPSCDASADARRRWPSLAQQRADALLHLATNGGGGVVGEVVVHVRGDGCTMDDGTPIADHSVASLLPTTFIRALIHDAERRPINASGRQRHPTTRQKRVVHERDRACVDCGSTDLLQYDHNPAYRHSRETTIDDLERRCANCHHARHNEAEREREERRL